jgi:Ca2+-dependent lipid-binding protein
MAQGTIKLDVVEANGLVCKANAGNPYVKLRLGDQKHRTKVVEKNLNPRWNESFNLYVFDTILGHYESVRQIQRT